MKKTEGENEEKANEREQQQRTSPCLQSARAMAAAVAVRHLIVIFDALSPGCCLIHSY